VAEDDVWHVRHDHGAQAERARLDRREQGRSGMPLPEKVSAALQGLELGVGELRAELTLPGPPS
jgi:hypothetical protein